VLLLMEGGRGKEKKKNHLIEGLRPEFERGKKAPLAFAERGTSVSTQKKPQGRGSKGTIFGLPEKVRCLKNLIRKNLLFV